MIDEANGDGQPVADCRQQGNPGQGSQVVRLYLIGAGVNGAMGVALGAWAAHGLDARLSEAAVEWVRTGASYQLLHAAALLGLAALAARYRMRRLGVAGWALGLGALVFAGALYLRAFTALTWIVALAPVGGLSMMTGWLALISAAFGFRAKQ